MKTIAAIAIALMLASRTEAAPEPAAGKCMSFPPFCPYGQAPLCVCQDDYSYNCIWMCASTR